MWQTAEHFSSSTQNRHKLHSWCKECTKTAIRDGRARNQRDRWARVTATSPPADRVRARLNHSRRQVDRQRIDGLTFYDDAEAFLRELTVKRCDKVPHDAPERVRRRLNPARRTIFGDHLDGWTLYEELRAILGGREERRPG